MHLKKIIKLLYILLLFVAAIMLIPATLAFIWKERIALKAFLLSILFLLSFCGILRLYSGKTTLSGLSQRDGFLFTSLTWLFAAAFGAIPFVITKTLPNYSDAFFEVISGLTTTGASRIMDVENCLRSILFWRSFTNWLGGMGIVVLFIAILPAFDTGPGAFNLMGAETVGPVKGKLTPKTRTTALILWGFYLGITVAETIFLLLGGLGFFDAITISFSTVSTAGFSVKNASISAYNSAYVDVVVTAFMLIASINFSLFYKVYRGKIKEVMKDAELKIFLFIVSVSSLSGAVFLRISNVYKTFASALRYMAFQIASVISTTGFANDNYMLWPSFAIMLLILMMFVGACAGSTGGGIKVIRVHVVFASAINSIKRKTHPNSIYRLSVNGEILSNDMIFSIFTFCTVYIVTWLLSTLVISLTGMSIQDCLSSTLLTLGNIGIGFGKEAFANYPHWSNWVFSFLMLVGRLELTTVYVLFTRIFWR